MHWSTKCVFMLFFGDVEGDWWTTKHGSFDNNLLFIPVLLPLVWSWLLNSSRCLVLLGPAKFSSVLKVLSTSWVLVDWRLVDFESFQYWICHRLLFLIILSCVALGNQCHNWLFKILLCDVFPHNIHIWKWLLTQSCLILIFAQSAFYAALASRNIWSKTRALRFAAGGDQSKYQKCAMSLASQITCMHKWQIAKNLSAMVKQNWVSFMQSGGGILYRIKNQWHERVIFSFPGCGHYFGFHHF